MHQYIYLIYFMLALFSCSVFNKLTDRSAKMEIRFGGRFSNTLAKVKINNTVILDRVYFNTDSLLGIDINNKILLFDNYGVVNDRDTFQLNLNDKMFFIEVEIEDTKVLSSKEVYFKAGKFLVLNLENFSTIGFYQYKKQVILD